MAPGSVVKTTEALTTKTVIDSGTGGAATSIKWGSDHYHA